MWIKICGIRDPDTAAFIADQSVDAIGLNFYQPSPRSVSVPQAAEICDAVKGRCLTVGLFVNHTLDEVERIRTAIPFDMLQFHGDEPPEFLTHFPDSKIIRAFRVGADGLRPVAEYLRRCRELQALPWACLIDAAVVGQYGGSGVTVDWQRMDCDYHGGWPPMILAGGLTPANVTEAIRLAQPWGIDVASGVERQRGVKDRGLILDFLAQARSAPAC